MSYTHNGRTPVDLKDDPIGTGSTDWVFFVLGSFLRTGETVTEHAAVVLGGELVIDSTYLGSVTDPCGTTYTEAYGVKVKPTAGSSRITVTLTFSTSTTGDVDVGRANISRSVTIPVRTL